jgi:PTH1 family peptidyl-tRNA hydrolase
MNLSGTAVRQLVAFFKADINNLIVFHDDLDLPFGTIRLKTGGGNAGHKGLASITENLGSSDFMRVRIGIGRPSDKSRIEGYVLEPFKSDEELSMLPKIIQAASEASAEIVLSGTEKATAKCQKNILVNF